MSSILDVISVSRETIADLRKYEDMAVRWSSKINLVSRLTIDQFFDRHVVDSAQIYPFIPENASNIIDIGSGGGLPAIVLSVISKHQNSDHTYTLIESDQRKSTFLRQVTRELDLPVKVLSQRIEDVEALGADVVTARALAPLDSLLSYADHHLSSDGVAIFPKGKMASEEIHNARANWTFDCKTVPSKTSDESQILLIENIKRAST